MSKQQEHSSELQQPGYGFLARAFWMMGGNIILAFSAVSIFHRETRFWGAADMVFWITVMAMAIVRYLDIQIWKGLTAMGAPATKADWRKYTIRLAIISAVIWILSHALNPFIVSG